MPLASSCNSFLLSIDLFAPFFFYSAISFFNIYTGFSSEPLSIPDDSAGEGDAGVLGTAANISAGSWSDITSVTTEMSIGLHVAALASATEECEAGAVAGDTDGGVGPSAAGVVSCLLPVAVDRIAAIHASRSSSVGKKKKKKKTRERRTRWRLRHALTHAHARATVTPVDQAKQDNRNLRVCIPFLAYGPTVLCIV